MRMAMSAPRWMGFPGVNSVSGQASLTMWACKIFSAKVNAIFFSLKFQPNRGGLDDFTGIVAILAGACKVLWGFHPKDEAAHQCTDFRLNRDNPWIVVIR